MTTWAGALVELRGRGDVAAIAARHRIALVAFDAMAPWLLIQADVNFTSLNPPGFAEELSRELHTNVIGFFLQSTASVEQVEQVEHWNIGRR